MLEWQNICNSEKNGHEKENNKKENKVHDYCER